MVPKESKEYQLLLHVLEERLDKKGKECLKDSFAGEAKIKHGVGDIGLFLALLSPIIYVNLGILFSTVGSVVFWIYVGIGVGQSTVIVWENKDSFGIVCLFKGHKWCYPYKHSEGFGMMCNRCTNVCTISTDKLKEVLAPYISVMSSTRSNI